MFSSPCSNCRKRSFLFLFNGEDDDILAGIVVGDAKNTSIVVLIGMNISIIAVIKLIFFIDVDLVDIGIVRVDVCVGT